LGYKVLILPIIIPGWKGGGIGLARGFTLNLFLEPYYYFWQWALLVHGWVFSRNGLRVPIFTTDYGHLSWAKFT